MRLRSLTWDDMESHKASVPSILKSALGTCYALLSPIASVHFSSVLCHHCPPNIGSGGPHCSHFYSFLCTRHSPCALPPSNAAASQLSPQSTFQGHLPQGLTVCPLPPLSGAFVHGLASPTGPAARRLAAVAAEVTLSVTLRRQDGKVTITAPRARRQPHLPPLVCATPPVDDGAWAQGRPSPSLPGQVGAHPKEEWCVLPLPARGTAARVCLRPKPHCAQAPRHCRQHRGCCVPFHNDTRSPKTRSEQQRLISKQNKTYRHSTHSPNSRQQNCHSKRKYKANS